MSRNYSAQVRSAVLAATVTAILAALVLAPAVAFPDGDDFPLSPYAMFARNRGSTSSLATVVGLDADGEARRLSPRLVNGTAEVVQASAVVAREVAAGHAERLCAEVAGRVGAAGPSAAPGRSPLVAVEVVTETFDAVAWFDGEQEPLRRTVHASCAVSRR